MWGTLYSDLVAFSPFNVLAYLYCNTLFVYGCDHDTDIGLYRSIIDNVRAEENNIEKYETESSKYLSSKNSFHYYSSKYVRDKNDVYVCYIVNLTEKRGFKPL